MDENKKEIEENTRVKWSNRGDIRGGFRRIILGLFLNNFG